MNNNNFMPGIINNFNFMPNMMVNNNSNLEDEEWLKGFKSAVEEINNINKEARRSKINVIFKTTQGTTHTMVYNYGTTIDKMLEKYLIRVGKSHLYGDKDNKICFLFNGIRLRFGDQTPIEEFFKDNPNPSVIVNEIINMICG